MYKILAHRLIVAAICLSLHEIHHCSGAQSVHDAGVVLDFEFGEVIRIIVDAETKGEVAQKWTFAPSAKTHRIFSEENGALGWQIREFLASTVFTCPFSGGRLTIREEGDAEEADVRISYEKTEELTNEHPLEFTLRLDNPAALTPGFYSGKIKIVFHSERMEPNQVTGYLPVEILVRGRRIHSLAFTDVQKDSLDYGSPCDVEILIDTFGLGEREGNPQGTLGDGTLQLFHKTESEGRKLLAIELPLKRPLDPRLEIDPNECVPEWRDYAIFSEATNSEVVPKTSVPGDAKRYRVVTHVGAAGFVGNVTAQLEWQQDSISIQRSPLKMEKSVRVGSGIRVFPAIAAVGEQVVIDVVSLVSLDSTVDLLLEDPGHESIPLLLKLDERTAKTPSQPFRYTGKPFIPRRTGLWTIRSATNDNRLQHSRAFRVLFRRTGSEVTPLVVFASPTPFWWGWNRDPFKGSGWTETRHGHFLIGADQDLIDPTTCRYRESGIFRVSSRRNETQFFPVDESREPLLKIGASAEAIDAMQREWVLPEKGLEFTTSVSVPPNNTNQPHPRHTEGTYAYVVRSVVQFDDSDGGTSARVVQVPFSVIVTNQWVHYKEWIGIGTLVFVVLGTMSFFYARTKIRTRRKRRFRDTDDLSETVNSGPTDIDNRLERENESDDLSLGITPHSSSKDDDMSGFGS